ncbi:MAG: alpha-amylase [Planctomycetes bacterium]|nr:alpha-amylase [Planctomycetota bacterium]
MTRHCPALYQVPTRVWLAELSEELGRSATLEDIPDEALDRMARAGFDWVWFLGVWQTGEESRSVSLQHPQWWKVQESGPGNMMERDVCGSPFAIQAYTLHADLGDSESLTRLRERLHRRGLRLMLDFVPNHTGLDHPWAYHHPEYYVQSQELERNRSPENYCERNTVQGVRVFAHGRDPFFAGWPDTLQLNWRHRGLREAMIQELVGVAGQCDGVRCDMAMLLVPDVFRRTWGEASRPADGTDPVDESFWPEAIARIRGGKPEFVFLAEVYWDLEETLQQAGFDYTYDKRLYDLLRAQDAPAVRTHLRSELEYQNRSARFLENHDEPRAAAAFPEGVHRAAACVTFLAPGLRLLQEGQFKGRRIRNSMHLARRPHEPTDPGVMEFYLRLLDCLRRPAARTGQWHLLESRPAWEGNPTWDRFVAYLWEGSDRDGLLVTVNYGPTRGQCYVELPFPLLAGKRFLLRDLLSQAWYERDGDALVSSGLYLDMPEWGYHVFDLVEL